MLEIRFHGRGGQGAVVASELLAQAAFLDGQFPQSFPFFGVERRGAPVTAYARIDRTPIQVRTGIARPQIVVVLEPGLLRSVPALDGLRPDGLLVLNSPKPPAAMDVPFRGRIAAVDATAIALELRLGSPSTPIVNTAMLGALAQASHAVSLDSLRTAIRRFVPAKPEENCRAAELGAEQLRERPALELAA